MMLPVALENTGMSMDYAQKVPEHCFGVQESQKTNFMGLTPHLFSVLFRSDTLQFRSTKDFGALISTCAEF